MGAALGNNIVVSVLEEVLSSALTSAKSVPAVASATWSSPVTGPCVPVSEEVWLEEMVDEIARLEAKYGAKYKSVEEGGVLHSAQVAIPRVDFSKVKPHLHRKLPKPESIPVQACSIDPNFYTSCTDCVNARSRGGQYPEHGYRACAPPFEQSSPFGALPGFVTSLGAVAVPEEPIGGYVYDGGSGDATRWRLHAEAVYV